MVLEPRTDCGFFPHRPRRERPLQRQGMSVPAKAFAARHRRTKVVPRCRCCVVLDESSSGAAFLLPFVRRKIVYGGTYYPIIGPHQALR